MSETANSSFITALYLHHFRCYEQREWLFSEGMNIIHGDNALGKTSLLEAIHLLMTGRSFRTQQAREMIQHDQPQLFVEAHLRRRGVGQVLKFAYDGQKRQITRNHTLLKATSQLLGFLPGVKVGPEDLAIVKGSPQHRRHFLDIYLAQGDPLYVHHLSRYLRALKQRNQLLKQRQSSTLELWEEELARSGAYIIQQRQLMVDELSQHAAEHFYELVDAAAELTLAYRPSGVKGMDELENQLQAIYQQQRRRELELGQTLSGPHKDDLNIHLDGQLGRSFGSEGQKRLVVIALHLAVWDLLRERCGLMPLMLLDDATCGLDAKRRCCLARRLRGMGQVFVTSPEPLELAGASDADVKYFDLCQDHSATSCLSLRG